MEHKSDDKAIAVADQHFVLNGWSYLKKTMADWKICCQWKDGSTSWEWLADLKESYTTQVAEYAVSQVIDHNPAFNWWDPHVLKKRDRIITAGSKHYHKRTHKFGIEAPKTLQWALEIDKENGNTLGQDALAKEMKNVKVAFEVLEDGKNAPIGYQFINCHMVFNIKLDGFKCKCRLMAGGHVTDTPAVMTYTSVVSCDSVQIALAIAALNDLEVKATDIQNAYLMAPCEEKIWTTLGPEFGPNQGKKAIIVHVLYGLKSARASFGRHVSDCMRHLGYKPCKGDCDMWMKPMVQPEDNYAYYAYMLLYVDDVLVIHHDATAALEELDHYFQMKPGAIRDPAI